MTSAQKPLTLLPSQIAFQPWLLLAFPYSQVKIPRKSQIEDIRM